MKTKARPLAGFKALDEATGTFEAIVSVFDNVDLAGDRVVKGAFAGSLKAWEQKGRPVPVIFSHQWDDLNAHIGHVEQAEERDEGLWVRASLDMADPFAAKCFRLMQRGTLAEFSFAYDVVDQKVQNGANELLELDLIEVGPTLKGVNPETQLLAAKALGLKEGRRNATKDAERIQAMHDLAVELDAKCDGAKDDEDGKARRAGRLVKQAVAGSFEATRDQVTAAVSERYASPHIFVFVHSTFPDRVVVGLVDARTAQGPEDADYREIPYAITDGAVVLGDERAVQIETVITSAEASSDAEPEATGQEPEGATPQEPKGRSTHAAVAAFELMELGFG